MIKGFLKNDSTKEQGFLKLTGSKPLSLSREEKIALNRKGNVFFNLGEFKKAERIFLTTGYTNGLLRMGDYYWANNEPLKAIKMYWLAPDSVKVEDWAKRASLAIRKCIKDDEKIIK